MALEIVMSAQPRMINDLGVTRVTMMDLEFMFHLFKCVWIKNRRNKIRFFRLIIELFYFAKILLAIVLPAILLSYQPPLESGVYPGWCNIPGQRDTYPIP